MWASPDTNVVIVSGPIGINLLRCTLSSFEAFVTVTYNQPAYKAYTQFLPSYMSAYCSQQKVSVIDAFHPLRYQTSDGLVTTHMPDISVSFPNLPDAALLERIRSEGGKDMTIKGSKIFLIPSPTSDLLRAIVQAGAVKTTPAASESVNIAALSSLNLIRRIFSCFLRTHSYPAFSDIDHMEIVMGTSWRTEVTEFSKRKASTVSDGPPAKRTRTQVASGSQVEVDEDIEMSSEAQLPPTGNRIVYALPPAKCPTAWGEDTAIPANDGLFIRYVEQTQNAQGERIIIEVLARYFLCVLGNNADACKAAIELLKGDVGIIANTSAGKELAHIAKCIDIGIQAQARVFPVISSGQYVGSALLGAGFQIHAYGSTYISVSATSLQRQIEQAGSHKSSLKAIAEIVSDDPENELRAEIQLSSTALGLHNALLAAYTKNEERDKIVQLARGLRFKPKSWNLSAQNLVVALSLIQNPTSDLPEDIPIHPTKYFETDRLSLVWGAFGDLAPTPDFPGGNMVDLTSSKDQPKHIGVRLVPLKDALVDMQRIITTRKFSGTSLNKRSGPFKDRIYTGLDGTRVMAAFASAAGVTQSEKGKGKERAVATSSGGLFEEGF
jgi:hypothetical protein